MKYRVITFMIIYLCFFGVLEINVFAMRFGHPSVTLGILSLDTVLCAKVSLLFF